MTLYIDDVDVKGRIVRYLKMSLDGESTFEVVIGWIDNFGNLHVKK